MLGIETNETLNTSLSTEPTFSKEFNKTKTPNSSNTEIIVGIVLIILCIFIAVGSVIFCWVKKRQFDFVAQQNQNKAIVASKLEAFLASKSIPFSSILDGNVSIPPEHEFIWLTNFEDVLCPRFFIEQGRRYNKIGFFNLVPENLPFDHNRVKLKNPVEGCDYVNASWLSNASDDPTYDEEIYTSYLSRKDIKFAIGQNPIPATMQHHYQMILENQIDIIVGFSRQSDEPLQVGKTCRFNEMSLTIESRNQISDHLFETKIVVRKTTASGVQNVHHAVCFEIVGVAIHGMESSDYAKKLVSSICLIRNEMKKKTTCFKVFVSDPRGGVQGAAAFVVLYDLLQQVDEGLTGNDKVKSSVTTIDVFDTVNMLRQDRANAIEDYETYKSLFHCLNHYGPNRRFIQQQVFKKVIGKHERHKEAGEKNTASSMFPISANNEGENE